MSSADMLLAPPRKLTTRPLSPVLERVRGQGLKPSPTPVGFTWWTHVGRLGSGLFLVDFRSILQESLTEARSLLREVAIHLCMAPGPYLAGVLGVYLGV
jgi:hypothetical protein